MVFRAPSATIRSDSSFKQYQKRVPADVLEKARGRCCVVTLPACAEAPETAVHFTIGAHVKFSLRVRLPACTKQRSAAVTAQIEKLFASICAGPVELAHKQIIALAGEIYRLVVERFEMSPGTPRDWEAWKAFTWAAFEGRVPNPPTVTWNDVMNERAAALSMFGVSSGPLLLDIIEQLPLGNGERSLEVRFGLLASWVLAKHGLEITAASRVRLLREMAEAAFDAGWAMKRAASGDYTPDPKAVRIPKFESLNSPSDLTLQELFDRWREEIRPAASTVTTWRAVLTSFRAHKGDQPISSLCKSDFVSWKQKLIAQGLATGTINRTYLACINTLLSYAVRNELIASNVASGVKVDEKRRAGVNRLPYEDRELASLLAICKSQDIASRRWIPLLAACSGARGGELAQLWAERVRLIDGIPVMELRPAEDAGSLKNAHSERQVPLHPVLVEDGFLLFAREKGSGPLFYGIRKSKAGAVHRSKKVVNNVSMWIRSQPGFNDPRKDPLHAIRHWWKSKAAAVRIPDSSADAIQGHAAKTEAGRYRHFNLSTLAEDIARIPVPLLK